MSAQIKEALPALEDVALSLPENNESVRVIRFALKAAQQQAEDLQTIAEWKRADVNRDAALQVYDFYFRMLLSGPRGWSMPFDDFDPMKAIHDAAEWIRKEAQ